MQVVRRCFYLADTVAAIDLLKPDWVVISAHLADCVQETVALLQGTQVLAVATNDAEERTLRAWGISNVVRYEVDSLHKVMKHFDENLTPRAPVVLIERPEVAAVKNSRVVGVCGGAGAPGRSSISVSVAACLAKGGTKTLLIDADMSAPAVSALLELNGDSNGLLRASRLFERGGLTAATLEQSCAHPAENLFVLGNQTAFGGLDRLAVGALAEVITIAQSNFAYVVLDLGVSARPATGDPFGELGSDSAHHAGRLLAMCTDVWVCGLPTPLGVTRLLGTLSKLVDLKLPAEQRVILNRCPRGRGKALADETAQLVATHVKKLQVTAVTRDDRAFTRAEQSGKPLVTANPNSPASKA
jgi:MinD-like ATPase involved in chromosome partitioning or flagellar assembly